MIPGPVGTAPLDLWADWMRADVPAPQEPARRAPRATSAVWRVIIISGAERRTIERGATLSSIGVQWRRFPTLLDGGQTVTIRSPLKRFPPIHDRQRSNSDPSRGSQPVEEEMDQCGGGMEEEMMMDDGGRDRRRREMTEYSDFSDMYHGDNDFE
uniref:Uncharacterized protein n=1 Tax=Pristionchus pacificus TaxID=54126 RepID=A0A2A6BJE5_PRIPA|eukprot:PDM66035.1 hypothetical protein PRIPAC_46462 [Pristionchus pacificus]